MRDELEFARTLLREAGALALRYYQTPLVVEEKPGAGPVTEADRAVNALLVAGLQARFPHDAILAEESVDDPPRRLSSRRVWLVDPIDGTREFISGSGEFSVMLGLIDDGRPVLGLIFRPTLDQLFYGGEGLGAFLEERGATRPLRVSQLPFARLRLAVAKPWRGPRVEQICAHLGVERLLPMGSISLKLALIAAGEADLYVNPSGYLAEWDTGPGEAILRAAGGLLTDLSGAPLAYNQADILRPHGVVASHGSLHHEILQRIASLTI